MKIKRKVPENKPVQPRSMDEINQDYGRLVSQAGQCQYQISVLKGDLKKLNESLRNLNYEAAARQSLDQKAKEAQESKQMELSLQQEA